MVRAGIKKKSVQKAMLKNTSRLACPAKNISEPKSQVKKPLKPKNLENLALYSAFRIHKLLQGELKIKTGKMNRSLILNKQYNLKWVDFTDTIKVCIVNVN